MAKYNPFRYYETKGYSGATHYTKRLILEKTKGKKISNNKAVDLAYEITSLVENKYPNIGATDTESRDMVYLAIKKKSH